MQRNEQHESEAVERHFLRWDMGGREEGGRESVGQRLGPVGSVWGSGGACLGYLEMYPVGQGLADFFL